MKAATFLLAGAALRHVPAGERTPLRRTGAHRRQLRPLTERQAQRPPDQAYADS